MYSRFHLSACPKIPRHLCQVILSGWNNVAVCTSTFDRFGFSIAKEDGNPRLRFRQAARAVRPGARRLATA